MDSPTYAVPEPAPPVPPTAHDPLAVALGNASLLGVGYLLLGRRRLAVAAGAVTLALVVLLLAVARTWVEVLVLLWWAAVIAHGWFLAGGRTHRVAVRRQRLVALGVTVTVLLVVALLRVDAASIERGAADARDDGDCAKVLSAQDRMWFGPHVADAPLTAHTGELIDTCHRLRAAQAGLTTGLNGDTQALKAGFDTLTSVLAEPGNEKTVGAVLNAFLGGLPAKDPCHTATVTDWLRQRRPSHDALDGSAGTVARTAPAALVGCGDQLMTAKSWTDARSRYQQLLDQYAGDALTPKARDGVDRATLMIELANVRRLLEGPSDEKPEYCSKPAKYGGADRYGKGVNRAMFFGNDRLGKLPAAWRTKDAAHAVLVVCASDERRGSSVRTCPYRSKISGHITYVTFHRIAIPVKVYELRTGKLVAHRTVQIGGSSCPRTISYTTYGIGLDTGPDSDQDVKASKADVRAAFRSLVDR